MLAYLVLVLCGIGAVFGSPTAVTENKNRRDAFFRIVTEKSDPEGYTARAAAELPIKFGHGSNLPVVVLPLLVNSQDPDYESRPSELISLKNLKYSLAPQYVLVGNQEDNGIRSRARYIMVEPQSAEDFDDPIIIAESPSDNNYPVYRPTTRMRKKFVIRISPRQTLRVSGNLVSSTTPSRGYIPVSEIPTTTPSREYIPVTDNIFTTPSPQFQLPLIENVAPSTPPPNQLAYVAGDVILSTPAPQNEWQLVGNVVSITPPPKNINYTKNNVFYIREDSEQRTEDISDQPKNQSAITFNRPNDQLSNITYDHPKDQSPNITTELPKDQSLNITSKDPKDQTFLQSDRPETPLNFIWNVFNYPFSSPENKTTVEPSKPQITTDPLTPPKGPYNPTTTVRQSDPLETSSGSPQTPTTKGPEMESTTEKPDSSASSKPRRKPDSSTTTNRPSIPKTLPQTGRNRREAYIPFAHGFEHIFDTTPEMIRSYQLEKPYNPKQPAVIPSGRKFPERIPSENDNPFQATIPGPSPARPWFKRSMRLRIDVTVPRSDYTEAYDLQWHAGTNTARTVVEDGATIFYRMPLFDDRMQYLKFKVDTWNGTAMGRCTMSPLLPASPRDHEFPGLPDLTPFQFIGYTASEEQPLVERWRHWVIGKPGQDGAAIGESLNYTHDFLLYRDRGEPMPFKYTMVAHSSVLGPYSDSYTHRYRILPAPTGPMLPDRKKMCQIVEHMKEEPSLKHRQRDSTTRTPPREIQSPDNDLPSENEDITSTPNLGTENLEVDAVNKGGIAANINIGTGHDANLVSDRQGVVANINIGAGGLVTHRIVANINIGAGSGTLDTDTKGIANLIFGAGGLNDRLEGDANLNFGTRGIDNELSSNSRKGLANLNVGTKHRGTGVGLDKGEVDENRNLGNKNRGTVIDLAKDVDENINFGKGSVSAKEVLNDNVDGNTHLGKETLGDGITSDKGNVDPSLSLGTRGSKKGDASGKGGVEKTLNNGIEGVSTEAIDQEGVNVYLKNKTGDLSESGGENELSEADAAKKYSFNPLGDFLGQTKSKKYDDLFEQYKKKYKRKYKDDGEEAVRKAQFIKSLRYVEAANRIATNYKLGINYMSDRLKDELRPLVSGVPLEPDTSVPTNVDLDQIPPGASVGGPGRRYEEEFKKSRTIDEKVNQVGFPVKFNWQDMGFNTEVRHQGAKCLSCSLMATTAALEGLIFVKTNVNKLLSPRSMLDCGEKFSKELKWCQATFPRDAFKFIKDKGLPSDDVYNFVTPPEEPMCKDDVMSAAKIKDFYDLRMDAGPSHLRLAIKSRSPAVVVFKVNIASSPQMYEEGILDDMRWCDNAKARHAVLAVGFDFTTPGQEHFIFKNSWGEGWGEKGYAKIKSGACNVLSDVSYPVDPVL